MCERIKIRYVCGRKATHHPLSPLFKILNVHSSSLHTKHFYNEATDMRLCFWYTIKAYLHSIMCDGDDALFLSLCILLCCACEELTTQEPCISIWVGDFFSRLNDTTKYIIIILAQSLLCDEEIYSFKSLALGERKRKSWQRQRLLVLRCLTNKVNNHTAANGLIMLNTQTNALANHCKVIPSKFIHT